MPGSVPKSAVSQAWQYQADGPLTSSPTVAEGVVYQGTGRGTLVALELESGELRWSHPVGGGLSGSLIVGKAVIVGSSKGTVTALDRDSGRALWTTKLDGEVRGAPLDIGGAIAVGTSSGTVSLLSPKDGEAIWQASGLGHVNRSLAGDGRMVIVPAEPGRLIALDLSTGDQLWTAALAPDGGVGSPSIGRGLVFTATGLDGEPGSQAIVAVDIDTGVVRWRWASPTGDPVYSPALGDRMSYSVSEAGFAIALDPRDGHEAWRSKTAGPAEALAAIADDSVLIAGNGSTLAALDASTGRIRWEVPIAGVPYAPVAACGFVLVPSDLGSLTAFGAAS